MNVVEFNKQNKLLSSYFEETISACQSLLYNHPIAKDTLSYINSRLSVNTQKKFQFAYFPEDKYIDTLFEMVSKDKLYNLHLLYNQYIADGNVPKQITYGSLGYHNLIMPYKDMYGNIVALVGRSILPEEERKILSIPKYKNTTFIKSLQLFGFNLAKQWIIEEDAVLIVEGQLDCIAAQAKGYRNTVALGGVAFSAYQFHMLNRYTNNFYLTLDNDKEGQAASEKIIRKYSHLANIKSITIPNGYKDLDEALRNNCYIEI